MGAEIFIPLSFFAVVFGIVYLYLSSRNKERLALIEKGADASIFTRGPGKSPIWKVIILNLALLLMGIGVGILIATLIYEYTTIESDALGPAIVFIMAGVSLLVGFKMTSNMDKE